MKTNLLRTSIVVALAAVAAFAQDSMRLKADIPFNFMAGTQAMPAGSYTVDPGPGANTVAIRSTDSNAVAFVIGHSAASAVTHDTDSLVFHRYGDTYFLSEVWNAGHDGQKLAPSSREREIAAELAGPGNTTIAALRRR